MGESNHADVINKKKSNIAAVKEMKDGVVMRK